MRGQQPFVRRPSAPDDDPLAWLDALDIIDKHRRVHMLVTYVNEHTVAIPTGNLLRDRRAWGPIADGMEYARPFFRDPEPQLFAEITPGLGIEVEGQYLSDVLTEVPTRVRDLVEAATL